MLALCCLYMSMFTACVNKNDSKGSEESFTIEGENGQKYQSYQEACRACDFEAAHAFLDRIKKAKVGYKEEYNYSSDKEKAIKNAEKEIFKYEMNYLVSQNTVEANNRLIYLLNEGNVPTPINEGAIINYSYIYKNAPGEFGNNLTTEFEIYSNWVNDYNSRCDQILDFCILTHNEDLAKKILLVYRQDLISIHKKLPNGYENRAHYTNETKNKAKSKYDEAVKSGIFK